MQTVQHILSQPSSKPQRIISLVPSQTELLYDLGLRDEVVGITKFCVHPNEWFKNKTRIGGTKNIDIEKIKALQPDLIIANKEENVKEQVEALESKATIYTSDIQTLDDALQMIYDVGAITNTSAKANEIANNIQQSFALLQKANSIKTCYLIWREPYMSIGGDTFIHDMLTHCGFENICINLLRYPALTIEEIIAQKPELVLLSSEPYPFKEKHIAELQTHLPTAKIILVDGEMFSWYGSRLLYSVDYFKNLIASL